MKITRCESFFKSSLRALAKQSRIFKMQWIATRYALAMTKLSHRVKILYSVCISAALFYSPIVTAMDPPYDVDHYLSYFSIENIKKAINADEANGAAIMRTAFPDEVWVNEKTEHPNEYIKTISPLKDLSKLIGLVTLQETYRYIQPLQKAWLEELQKLHKFIVNEAIRASLMDKEPDYETIKIWQSDFIKFFFEPLSGLRDTHNPTHYTNDSRYCPSWLKSYYFFATIKLPIPYSLIQEEMKSIYEDILLASTVDNNKTSKQMLQERGYSESLNSFADRFFPNVEACNKSKEAMKKRIQEFFKHQPSLLDNIFIHRDLVYYLLQYKENIFSYNAKKKSCEFHSNKLYCLLLLYSPQK